MEAWNKAKKSWSKDMLGSVRGRRRETMATTIVGLEGQLT